jgi:hypothetical protein
MGRLFSSVLKLRNTNIEQVQGTEKIAEAASPRNQSMAVMDIVYSDDDEDDMSQPAGTSAV